MAEIKWIKLYIEMFNSKKIKYLRKLPNGNDIVLIWVMLLAMAGKCNAGGMIFLTENIPYNTKMLADELDFEENVVILALEALNKLGMINRDCDDLAITNWEEYQSIDSMEKAKEANRLRQQKWYNEHKKITTDEQPNVSLTLELTQPNASRNKNKEIRNKNKEIIKETNKENDFSLVEAFSSFWSSYPRKTNKTDALKAFQKVVKTPEDLEKILASLDAHKQSYDWQKEGGRFIPYPATWLNRGGYMDEVTPITPQPPAPYEPEEYQEDNWDVFD